ncbi:MAG: DNA-binding protein [Bacteroidales bacterium]|nr:DNA-binding protein [Bacteroidales bacterium]
MELLTTTQMAEKWDISRRRVTTLCKEGRIEGAMLRGNTWLIPDDAEKPDDIRRVRKLEQSVQYNETKMEEI